MGDERRAPQPDPNYRTITEAKILAMLKLGGFAFDIEAGRNLEADALSRLALQSFIDLGVGFREGVDGSRLFDPVEVLNTMKWSGLTNRNTFWRDRYVSTGRKLVGELAKACVGGAFRLQLGLNRTFSAASLQTGGRQRLRLPLPLDLRERESLKHGVEGLAPGAFREDLSPGRYEVRLDGAAPGPVRLSADVVVRASPIETSAELTEQEYALYTQRSEGLIQVTPAIEALANHLSPGQPTSKATVQAFWDYMIDEMACGAVRYGELPKSAPADACLQSRWYDCQLGAALLAAMCRAKGIPARMVGGYVAYRLAPTNHFWAEVWIPREGWRVYDFLSFDLSYGGTDPQWRNHFAGRSDFRIVTERYPHEFCGLGSVRLPAHWQMVQYATEDGIAVDYCDRTGVLIYSDHVSVSYRSQ